MMAAVAVWFAVTVVERSGPPVPGEPGPPPAATPDTSSSAGDPMAGADLRETAAAVEGSRPLAAQKEPVRRFFVGAGAVLSAMARPGDAGPGAD